MTMHTRPRESGRRWSLGSFRQRGLRWTFNATLLPVVAVTVGLLILADYRHERDALLAAHHAPTVARADGTGLTADIRQHLDAVRRRSLLMHAAYGVLLLSVIAAGLNAALSRFVLKPMTIIDAGIRKMERGHWRTPILSARRDEVGCVVENFQLLGLKVDAIVAQLVRAERLATLALLANRATAEISPRVEQIAAAVGELQRLGDGPARVSARAIAVASAEILVAVREFDRLFAASLNRAQSRRRQRVTEALECP